jgi:hypothetical protein
LSRQFSVYLFGVPSRHHSKGVDGRSFGHVLRFPQLAVVGIDLDFVLSLSLPVRCVVLRLPDCPVSSLSLPPGGKLFFSSFGRFFDYRELLSCFGFFGSLLRYFSDRDRHRPFDVPLLLEDQGKVARRYVFCAACCFCDVFFDFSARVASCSQITRLTPDPVLVPIFIRGGRLGLSKMLGDGAQPHFVFACCVNNCLLQVASLFEFDV